MKISNKNVKMLVKGHKVTLNLTGKIAELEKRYNLINDDVFHLYFIF